MSNYFKLGFEGFTCNLEKYQEEVAACDKMLREGTGKGNDFLGWVDLPVNCDQAEIDRIKKTAEKLRTISDVVVCVGIGGSYLGLKMGEEFLNKSFTKDFELLYAGHTMSTDYTKALLKYLEDKDFSVIVASKSGTTTEPAIAFRLLLEMLNEKYEDVSERVVAITDKSRGALRQLADTEGYETYVIPDNVGGRYSVLTPIGLLGLAVAGYDVDAIMGGAKAAHAELSDVNIEDNEAYKYAVLRNDLYRAGKPIEMLVNYEPALVSFNEWWKQLYGESEGKDGKGIFPASASYSTDLHSLGQYVQDGERIMFETIINVDNSYETLTLTENDSDLDGLNYLAGKTLDYVNKQAMEGTKQAHLTGNVPQIILTIPDLGEKTLGYIIYFFELACGISGYMLDVNPFDQPGVEEYKKNMFQLLGKPGF